MGQGTSTIELKLPAGASSTTKDDFADILPPDALAFVERLQRRFGAVREECLRRRHEVQKALDGGRLLEFLPETREIRESAWTVGPLPTDLQDRRVEITGPVDRKMVINALNSGAKVFMADFEDSHAPTWSGTLQGQRNLRDAVEKTIEYQSPEGKQYRLGSSLATLVVRPRGWHLPEKHVLVDGKPISASLFDFGLYFFHNVKALRQRGTGPYFYLPKMEHHLEARLWNDVFVFAQKELGIPVGTIKATVLIETIPAAFQMDEILYELREHCAGLNCGRWDYIFSFIKKFRARPDFVLPDRAAVTMREHFLNSYCELLVKTCHRRRAFAMGGMAAQIPIKDDPEANRAAIAKVVSDKEREVGMGFDGTWVAHPGLVAVAKEVFDAGMKGPNQLGNLREDVKVSAADLLTVPKGEITEAGLRTNIRVGVQYLEAWLGGNGCVPLYHLMEDAATAEICRAQLWQWIRHPAGRLSDGRKITTTLFRDVFSHELASIKTAMGEERARRGKLTEAAELFDALITDENFAEFLTLRAYDLID